MIIMAKTYPKTEIFSLFYRYVIKSITTFQTSPLFRNDESGYTTGMNVIIDNFFMHGKTCDYVMIALRDTKISEVLHPLFYFHTHTNIHLNREKSFIQKFIGTFNY